MCRCCRPVTGPFSTRTFSAGRLTGLACRSGRGYPWSPLHRRLGLGQLLVAAAATGRRPAGRPRADAE